MSTDLDALRRYAADHHGVLTGAAAAALGVREVELLDLLLAGELALIPMTSTGTTTSSPR